MSPIIHYAALQSKLFQESHLKLIKYVDSGRLRNSEVSLWKTFGNLRLTFASDSCYLSPASNINTHRTAIKQAIEIGTTGAELLASLPQDCNSRSIELVESYLNRNSPKDCAHFVVKVFNQNFDGPFEAILSNIPIRPVKLRVKTDESDSP